MKKVARLTDLEIKIMKVLWDHERDMTIQEITECLSEDKLSVPSVTQSVKHLINKKAVVVCNHVLVSSVYARTFGTCFTPEEFLLGEFKRLEKCVLGNKKVDKLAFAANILTDDAYTEGKAEDFDKVQNFINSRK